MQFNDGTHWDMDSMDSLPILSIEAIAHALSNICRYGGHVDCHYSVAQHSVVIAKLVPQEFFLEGLLHDASEAYIGDIPAPMKWRVPEIKGFEEGIQEKIFKHYGLQWPIPDIVEYYDKVIGYTEMTGFFSELNPEIEEFVKQRCDGRLFLMDELGSSWTAREAKQRFIDAYHSST